LELLVDWYVRYRRILDTQELGNQSRTRVLTALKNNPLHISLFPPDKRDDLEFSFLLSSCLDIFEARMPQKTADQDFGLLQAIDERLAMYGWLTNTGVKFVIIVDMEGRQATISDSKSSTTIGLRDSDLKPVCSDQEYCRRYNSSNRYRLSKHCTQHTSIY